MSGMHFDVVGKLQHDVEQRAVQVVGKRASLIGTEQVGSSNGADEQQIAGQRAHRLACLADDDRDVLGSVARCVQELEIDVADAQVLLMSRFVMRERQACTRTSDRTSADRGELACARDEVGVNVRLDRVGDREPMLARRRDVDVDVPAGVDHDRFLGAAARHEKRRLGESFVKKPEKHEVESPNSLLPRMITPAGPRTLPC